MEYLDKSIDKNLQYFRSLFKNDFMFAVREIKNKDGIKFFILSLKGMNDAKNVNLSLIKPIVESKGLKKMNDIEHEIQYNILLSDCVVKTSKIDDLLDGIFCGNSILLVENLDCAFIVESKGYKHRSIIEPEAEKSLQSPREGFVESLVINMTLIRRKLSTTKLKFEVQTLGRQSNTKCSICYIEGIAQPKIIKEVKRRLNSLDMDAVLGIGFIQEMISDSPLSPFKTIGNTERPDVVAAKLIEGRIAILLDGTPVVLTVPYLFNENFQSNDDYYIDYIYGSINRLIRITGIVLSIGIPGLAVALAAYHQELIPTSLLLSISAARIGVPFPTIVEALFLVTVFEILREAATRMPTFIGQTISIVGALVLGQAAVDARIVSAPMIIVVGLTGITSLLVPRMITVTISVRFLLLVSASIMGLYGYVFAITGVLIHLFSIRSFGVPYMAYMNLIDAENIKDTYIRAPWWFLKLRPRLTAIKSNLKRQGSRKGVLR